MAKCSICGGIVITTIHAVYRSDGSSSGNYYCQSCGAAKEWKKCGNGDTIIDMNDSR
jgi:hypothetical protein